jgi:hypothetical protein
VPASGRPGSRNRWLAKGFIGKDDAPVEIAGSDHVAQGIEQGGKVAGEFAELPSAVAVAFRIFRLRICLLLASAAGSVSGRRCALRLNSGIAATTAMPATDARRTAGASKATDSAERPGRRKSQTADVPRHPELRGVRV